LNGADCPYTIAAMGGSPFGRVRFFPVRNKL
jgi:hypothetical protein